MTKKVYTEDEKKELGIFWGRFVLWVLFGLVIPVCFIAYRFQLFQKVSTLNIGGWGLLVGVIVLVFCIVLLKYVLNTKKWAYWKQIVKGVAVLLLPLGFVIYALYCCRNTIDQLIQVLGCCLLSWAVAIVVNPMPEWAYNQSKGETADAMELAFKRYDEKKEK